MVKVPLPLGGEIKSMLVLTYVMDENARRLGIYSKDFCRSCGDEQERKSVEHIPCSSLSLSRRRMETLGTTLQRRLTDLACVVVRSIKKFGLCPPSYL